MRLTPSQQEALDIERHVCVTAGAGSGKTTVLVRRYLEILRKGNVTPREIVAITFTEKAAAEMKARVIEKLSEEEDQNRHRNLLEQMGTAPVSTIHSFCSHILREFPFQARVPANFTIVQGVDQRLLLQQTIKDTLKEIATNTGDRHRAELTRLLQRYGGQQKLVNFFSDMINQRDVVTQLMREVYDGQSEAEIREFWQQNARMKLMSVLDVVEFLRCLKAVLVVAAAKRSEVVKDLTQRLEVLSEQNPHSLEVLDLLKEIASLIVTGKNSIAKRDFIGTRVEIISVETEVNFLVSAAKKIKNTPYLGADDDFLISTTRDLLVLYKEIADNYQETKLSQGKLDQNDLQLKTRSLLRNNEEIRQKLVERHKYYMVDEYQDTNELQYELVMLFTNSLENATLFIVGDPKQSIYGFRGADVRVFEKTKKMLLDKQGIGVSLKENFRSLRNTIGFVNYFFHRLMGDGTETEFDVQYEALTQGRSADAEGNIEILLGKQSDEAVSEYALIAQHIKNITASTDEVRGGEDGGEAKPTIPYGDIAILIRYRSHLPDIEHALLEAGIPYLTTGGVGFYQRQEIYDIWNYLNFLNAPAENAASLVGVLRGPAFGISDAELYEISLQTETNFWEKAQMYQGCTDNLRRAVAILKKHIQIAHRLSVNQLIRTIVNETGMIGTLKTGKYGQQRLANYQKLLELARNFDGDENTRILPDFIEFLDILITEEPLEGDAPIEASDGAVQIMTIHAAKGLQFPVVILPCLNRKGRSDSEPFIDEGLGIGFSPLNPDNGYRKTEPEILGFMKSQAAEKGAAERKRLFYVGATRAEDRLILSGTCSDRGEARELLEWLHTHLGIGEAGDLLNLPVELEVFAGNNTNSQSFQLQIPIFRTLADTAPTDEDSDETTLVDCPEPLSPAREPAEVPAAFSAAELANYARCPLRYQLENVLRIPANGQAEADSDETEVDAAIRYTFSRIRQRPDAEILDTIIDQTSENYPEITTESTEVLRTSANNFINSELGETALNASEASTNQQIHANINEHIIDARFDRLFRDESGDWQVINYKTGEVQRIDTCRPEMELYSLLLHRRYPSQSTLTINFFFPEHNRCERMHFKMSQLQEIQEQWKQKISALQQGNYEKNLAHCCSCPYADPDGQCIITEA